MYGKNKKFSKEAVITYYLSDRPYAPCGEEEGEKNGKAEPSEQTPKGRLQPDRTHAEHFLPGKRTLERNESFIEELLGISVHVHVNGCYS